MRVLARNEGLARTILTYNQRILEFEWEISELKGYEERRLSSGQSVRAWFVRMRITKRLKRLTTLKEVTPLIESSELQRMRGEQ